MSAEQIQSQPAENTSGKGKDSVLPDELDRLNWSALFLNWVWAKKLWDDIDQFHRVQYIWGHAALILYTLAVFGGGGAFYFAIEKSAKAEVIAAEWKSGRKDFPALVTPPVPLPVKMAKKQEPEKEASPEKKKTPDLTAIKTAILGKKDKTALRQLREMATKNNPEALILLADLHATGHMVLKNASLAFNYYRRAAEAGDNEAQYRLGVLYKEGRGTPFDLKSAKKWFTRAAKKGHLKARKALEGLRVPLPPVDKPKPKSKPKSKKEEKKKTT